MVFSTFLTNPLVTPPSLRFTTPTKTTAKRSSRWQGAPRHQLPIWSLSLPPGFLVSLLSPPRRSLCFRSVFGLRSGTLLWLSCRRQKARGVGNMPRDVRAEGYRIGWDRCQVKYINLEIHRPRIADGSEKGQTAIGRRVRWTSWWRW